jgi:NAD(P)H-hydrate epimerase
MGYSFLESMTARSTPASGSAAAPMVLTVAEMRALEERVFAEGGTPEALMEEAGAHLAAAVTQFTPRAGVCLVFYGKGHNGGDALVAARHLAACGWKIHLRGLAEEKDCAPLTRKKLGEVAVWNHGPGVRLPDAARGLPLVLLDGLLGIGARGPLAEPVAAFTREINRLRATTHARTFAIDVPTGLDADTGAADPACVLADFTLTIGYVKQGMLADRAVGPVGRLAVLPLSAFGLRRGLTPLTASIGTALDLAPLLPPRRADLHKGDCGRVGIVAGSMGYTGAAILCAEAAVRAGAGLVTLYVTPDIHPIVAGRVAPEVMVQPVTSYLPVADARHEIVAAGPGLGRARSEEILWLIKRLLCPMIVDADALNALASNIETLRTCAGERLLTPHPGEMLRLDSASEGRPRHETVRAFTERYPVTLLLKGARTLVGQLGVLFSYNTTGTPGMATGGMGDVLTGVCAGLAAQKLNLYAAARVGAWLCGRAAELAIHRGGESEESLTPSAVIAHLGGAFRELRARCY